MLHINGRWNESMKSYLFTTETDRGGVMLCDINDFDTAVAYLCKRFDGVVKIESAEQVWQLSETPSIADNSMAAEANQIESTSAPVDEHAESPDLFG
ncbi:hypothetical protein EH243_10240 [Amphritea opalescens]|uniref:Uncharacterized protein n=1 Tax=Amphritea opalescens TaxID=2490544 RepID=A0A430KQ64_9GAMM|nr:hypothetical protein [Amphritea opalescens]RTE65647.1 hypothetical protein EH243_10240 [Amphritea opalescens]